MPSEAVALWHEVSLARFDTEEACTSHQGAGVIFVAYLLLAGFMAHLYSLVYKGGRPLVEGTHLWVFPHDLAMAGAHGTFLTYVKKNAGWHIAKHVVGGVAMALIYDYYITLYLYSK